MTGRPCDCTAPACPLAQPPRAHEGVPVGVAARAILTRTCVCCSWRVDVRVDGDHVAQSEIWRSTKTDPTPALPRGWLRVEGTFSRSTPPEDLAARIADAIRRARREAQASEDLLVDVQINRARGCEPIRALRILASTMRTLARRKGATPERVARIRNEIDETKARVWAGRN